MTTRAPYSGTQRKLVLAFDVGTTFSGISYSILDPGAVPEIRGVTRYPAQEQVGGDSKIPTVVYYDREGRVQAAGAEAIRDDIEDLVEDEGWTKAEFKLHLRPKTKSAAHVTEKIPALPPNKTAVDVLADFLRYLHSCAKTYIEDTHANGPEIWRSLEECTQFVLTHPNGWEGGQQALMRKAAIIAGLVPNTREGRARLSFVTEGEASLHFCLQSGLATDAVENSDGILIVDAGGGTIDVSHFQGSVFVTKNAEAYLTEFLQGSSFALDVPIMTQRFDKTTKLRFVNPEEPQFIQFGGLRDKDPELGIRHGQLRLPGTEVAKFFEPSIHCITKSIEDQLDSSEGQISSVFLVGGFAASNWLLTNLKNTFTPRGVNLSRPDSHTNKAVADGAVSFCIDHFVQARVAKHSYGICTNTFYSSRNTEHIARGKGVFVGLDGYPRIKGAFDVILPKTTKISETQEFRRPYRLQDTDQANLRTMSTSIKCFRGRRRDPRWMDEEAALYSTLFNVEADLSNLPLKAKHSIVTNETYYEAHYDVVLSLGLTEFKAFVVWKENGVEKRSPAEMVYDPELLITDDEALI